MADTKISALSALSAAASGTQFAVANAGSSYSLTVSALFGNIPVNAKATGWIYGTASGLLNLGGTPAYQAASATAASASLALEHTGTPSSGGGGIICLASMGSGTYSSGALLGRIIWTANLGNVTGNNLAAIQCVIDGSTSTTAGPTRIEFLTTPSGSVTRAVALTVDSLKQLKPVGSIVQAAQTLTDGATISIDASAGNVWKLTLGGTGRVLNTPTNLTDGYEFRFYVKQDATGSRTITWPSWMTWPGGSTPTLTTTANRYDLFGGIYDGTAAKARMWTIGQNYT